MPAAFRSPPRARLLVWGLIVALLGVAVPRLARENYLASGGELAEPRPMPALDPRPERWIGGAPLAGAALLGRVWVLQVWTFECVNCLRTLPYANQLVTRFGDALGVLGIHSPEFEEERDLDRLRAAMRTHDVRFPCYVDESLHVFHALGARGWPACYVVDRAGRVRGAWLGELHDGTARARALEALVRKLLVER